MESAIPDHLLRPRLRHARVADDFRPPGRAVVPRFDASVTSVSVACLGLQHSPMSLNEVAASPSAWLGAQLQADDGPRQFDLAEFIDGTGHRNLLWSAYWLDDGFEPWWQRVGHRWTGDATLFPTTFPALGRFAEIFTPSVDRIEAITDGEPLHGLASLASRLSGPVREQGYWGSMRDRIALSQTDAMAPQGEFRAQVDGPRITLQAPANLCVIRTGQDWSEAGPIERAAYLERIAPTMRSSTDLLQSSGAAFACLCSRHAWPLDGRGTRRDASFGLSLWRSLADLERWAEVQPTHLASYVGSVRHAERFGAATRFSRYHEVLVPAAQQARFEYRHCHAGTGVLPHAPLLRRNI